jgi:hypothetical protein
MKPEDLFDMADRVDSKQSFLEFVNALEADYRDMAAKEREHPTQSEPAANGWFNTSIGDFLESMRAWATDADLPEQPSWKAFARLLHEGKLYE